jgi:Putative MetA-pathway of phenol degradation
VTAFSRFLLLSTGDLTVGALLCITVTLFAPRMQAQGNYEIQVYGSDTVAPGRTMVELHSNFTIEGSTLSPSSSPTVVNTLNDGTLPTNHQLHETIEITQGWTSWFETGFYIFTSAGPGQGYKWVGDHIRPRIRIPESWKWPVGVSLSTEIGYQRPLFSPDTWTWEIRPIVDKQLGRWYLAFNPALERSWHGPSVGLGFAFSPNFKASYGATRKLQVGLEYYGNMGDITGFDPLYLQQHQIVPAIDYDFGPNWEFNLGVGVGVTRSTDHLLIKAILGRRFRFVTPKMASLSRPFLR